MCVCLTEWTNKKILLFYLEWEKKKWTLLWKKILPNFTQHCLTASMNNNRIFDKYQEFASQLIFNCSTASSAAFFVGPAPKPKSQAVELQDGISTAGETAVVSQSNTYIWTGWCWQFLIWATAGIQACTRLPNETKAGFFGGKLIHITKSSKDPFLSLNLHSVVILPRPLHIKGPLVGAAVNAQRNTQFGLQPCVVRRNFPARRINLTGSPQPAAPTWHQWFHARASFPLPKTSPMNILSVHQWKWWIELLTCEQSLCSNSQKGASCSKTGPARHTACRGDKLLTFLECREAHHITFTDRSTNKDKSRFCLVFFTFNSTYYSLHIELLHFCFRKHRALQKLMQTLFEKVVNTLLTGTYLYFHVYKS